MKKLLIVLLSAFSLVFVPGGCLTTGDAGKGVAPSPAAQSVAASANPYFTGDGGKGLSIAILVPQAVGFAEDQGYLSSLAQGEFVSAFTDYSAISVLDRQRLGGIDIGMD
jgi:hypothetical protein